MKPKPTLSLTDAHALACFFAMHHAAVVLENVGPRDIERVLMATFGLIEKKGQCRLTPRGKRAVKLAKTEIGD